MIVLIVAVALVLAAVIVFAVRWRNPDLAPHRITPAAGRILFPFIGKSISQPTLDAALRLARAEGATLVPAYVMTVPLQLDLQAPVSERCDEAMPLLDLIEQRAARLKVPVDSRMEVGRTARHALEELLKSERFDRIVVPAQSRTSDGFAGTDIAWLLEHAPGEIVVLRPETKGLSRNGQKMKPTDFAGERMASGTSNTPAREPLGSADGGAR